MKGRRMNEPETNDVLGQELPPQQSAEIPAKRKRGRPKGTTGIPWGKRLAPTRSSVKVLAEAQESLKEAPVKTNANILAPEEVLSLEKKKVILDDVRFAMMIPMAPRNIAVAVCRKHGINRKTAETVIARVQNEQSDSSGFAPYQLLELAQRVLVGVLLQKDRKHSDKLKAIKIADAMFGIARRPDEDAAVRSGAWLR